ncbi:hypothetical protein CI109_107418 [Kwoniella shandongensis]|uniref:Zn(2)-C6 fungal-type domain-containing protein n=1 Tax=Kwoniella shandongensis TaxID=1734106 RepID=A0AAJ8LQ65_9TREE
MLPVSEISSATSSIGVERLASGSTRSKLACAACRATKVRCIRGHGMEYACTRCLRYGLACTLPAVNKRRGRPRRTNGEGDRATSDTTPPDMNSSGSGFDSMSHLHTSVPSELGPLMEAVSNNQHVPQTSPQSTLSMNGQHRNGSTSNVDLYVPNSFSSVYNPDPPKTTHHVEIVEPPQPTTEHGPSSNNTNPNLDLSEYLDPADRTLQTNEPNGPFFHNYPAATARYERSGNGAISTSHRDDPGFTIDSTTWWRFSIVNCIPCSTSDPPLPSYSVPS